MIIYTPVQLELVFDGMEESKFNPLREDLIDGVPVLVEDVGGGRGKVIRVLSTDPLDYLRPEIAPGALVLLNQNMV